MLFLQPRWVFLVVLSVSLLALTGAQYIYGSIYRGWDSQYYYALAHSLVFDRDLDVTNNLLATPQPELFDRDGDGSWEAVHRRPDGVIPTKYPLGMSLVETPLVGVGYLARRLLELTGLGVPDAAGYSSIELWSVACGLVLIFAWGLVTLYRMVAQDFGQPAAALGLVGCWMGTSLFYYSAIFPFMAHAISFVLLVMVMHVTRSLSTDAPANRPLVWLGVCLAALFLVRPQQVVVALFLLPILFRVIRTQPVAGWIFGATAGLAISAAAVAAQVGMHFHQFEVFTVNAYELKGEGFVWLNPQFSIVLISVDRGLFSISPIVGLALAAYILHPRAIPTYAWPQLWNAVVQVFLVAAWSTPWQGDSFGCRMLSDNSAVIAVGLAVLIHQSRPGFRWVITCGAMAAVGWTTLLLFRYLHVV